MAFYSPEWVRKLLKEESKAISSYVSKKNKDGSFTNDFRDYIDSHVPFTLWLDIGLIRERVLKPAAPDILNVAKQAYPEDPSGGAALINLMLDKAYIATINKYIDARYLEISSEELETLLNNLVGAPQGETQNTINKYFSKTIRISNISKRNISVMLIQPKFTTVTFSKDFRSLIDYSDLGDIEYLDSPGRIVKDLLSGKDSTFFAKLQNVGHIEVDVISTSTKEIKRGQSSPRLLQALAELPTKNPRMFSALSKTFSKATGQAESRLLVRKKFSSSKMVFELLIENGMMVGIPESRTSNLLKAAKERAFKLGEGLTSKIRKSPNLLLDLETSKSYKQYLLDNIKSIIASGKPLPEYTITTKFKDTALVSISKIRINTPSKTTSVAPKVTRLRTTSGSFYSLASLQILINSHLQSVISANMGDGSRTNILNYRTGRFAASAKVERMSASREGMITAFYNYMKNPYQTFEPGFAMGTPKTRDPKLLISTSIREIAATKVGNRLRAVSV